jgi:hypothetical protein
MGENVMPVTIKRNSKNSEAVILLEAMLQQLKYSVTITAIFDGSLEKVVEQFQLANNLVADGIVGPKTWQVLYLRSNDYLSVSTKRFLDEIDLINAAIKLDIEVAAIKAVNEVESRRQGFVNDFPVILFERHIFWRRLEKYGLNPRSLASSSNKDILSQKAGGYTSPINEIKRLKKAQKIHKEAALESASWGLFQIMGYHWKVLNYQSIEDFVKRMKSSEVEHLEAFVRYMKVNRLASTLQINPEKESLTLSDFAAFARRYNGANYTKNRYHTKMLSAYQRYSNKEDALFAELSTEFRNAGWNQDRIQNEILTRLLETYYSAKTVSKRAPEHNLAFDAVRGNKINHPVYQIRQSADLAKIDSSTTDFFVRDFMQVRSQGGTDVAPMMIGKRSNNANNREGLKISDGILNSAFAQHFNWLREEINKKLAQQNISHKVRGFSEIAHRDAIQLIPFSQTVSRFAGAIMQYVQVVGNSISSAGRLQGIFATDGAFKQLQICHNSIDIGGSHYISINGMLNGKIEGNTDMSQRLLAQDRVTLWPLRIGGGANIYILSFKNATGLSPNDADFYAYEKISGSQSITDLRQEVVDKRNASNWKNVDMVALQARYNSVSEQVAKLSKEGASYQSIQQQWRNMMLQVGDEVLASDSLEI